MCHSQADLGPECRESLGVPACSTAPSLHSSPWLLGSSRPGQQNTGGTCRTWYIAAVAFAAADLPVSLAATCKALAQLLPQLTQQEVDQQQRQQQSRGRAGRTKQGKKAAEIPLDPLLLSLFTLASEVGTHCAVPRCGLHPMQMALAMPL